MRQYQVVGRRLPKDGKDPKQLYRMKLFAPNEVVAKSRFWYFTSKLRKLKRANGQILAVNEMVERKPHQVKNFGITVRWDSRHGTHNMFKEYRDTSLNGAVEKMYQECASRYRCRFRSIQILATKRLAAKETTGQGLLGGPLKQFHQRKIAFPLTHRVQRPSSRRFRTTFKAVKPSTY
eukprot:JP447385.1.p1 GENE.JP447385.1~~JP447385.1.p1  ORF type:complete len:186 (+),score=75.54 JP447385.1:25-558(+)